MIVKQGIELAVRQKLIKKTATSCQVQFSFFDFRLEALRLTPKKKRQPLEKSCQVATLIF
jgi:hypothetical protein